MLSQPQLKRILQKQFNTVGGVFNGVAKMMKNNRKATAVVMVAKAAMAQAAEAQKLLKSALYAEICLRVNFLLNTPKLRELTRQNLLRIKASANDDDVYKQAKLVEELEAITNYLAEN